MAETCEYGDLKDQLIRDRLVVGLIDAKLSEKLQHNTELPLETAISTARNSDTVKQQLKELQPHAQPSTTVDEVHTASQRVKSEKK